MGQLPKAGTKMLPGEKIILQTDGDIYCSRYDRLVTARCNEGSKYRRFKIKFQRAWAM